ncbi:unnamed protein product [Mytilus coruscus]|uniref:CCHC-type domain-containing protein n=1 Tax=Mytilus coruscus TaxID=42192 RepID=A0A6J8DUN8_MYTCO|nr:unnamed protein product [Mytilus coruscus]
MREIEEQRRQDSALKEKSSTSSPDEENISSDETTELKAMVQKLSTQLQEKETRTSTLTKNPMSTTTFIPDETIIHRPNDRNKRRKRDKGDSICWRCGLQGHIAVGCRVRLDNSRKVQHALNFQQVKFKEQHIIASLTTKEQRLTGTANEAICSLLQRQPYIESLAKSTNVMEDINITGTDEKVDIRREQLRDPVIRYWIDNVMKKKSPRREKIFQQYCFIVYSIQTSTDLY